MGHRSFHACLALTVVAALGRAEGQAAHASRPLAAPASPSVTTTDVPLSFWTGPDHPGGLPIGDTNGISWGDYDGDGFPDLFACESGNLWRNFGGFEWVLAQNVLPLMPVATIRYGASFGDYDNDGRADLALEPRKVLSGDTCFHMLRNAGGPLPYVEVTASVLPSSLCFVNGETIGWADTDGDGRLDMFLPAYPGWGTLPSTGNLFLRNLGPVGAGGSYQFAEQTAAAGLLNVPPDSARPEGAQFCDVDHDGDPDLYAGGFLYQNNSQPGAPSFTALHTSSSGIGMPTEMDEGALFLDYDRDGDDDLFVAYEESSVGLRLWENRGDGTFFAAESSIIDGNLLGAGLGLSAADWDGDGDVDLTTRHIFRRNQLVETGVRHFTLATHAIPFNFINAATPAWADWDRDGDLDCALGNYLDVGSFWINTLYDAGTPADQRRFVRVRVVRDSASVPGGLQNEFGAVVELQVQGEPGDLHRRQFVASGHGYLNQNEYDLTFALPADPVPGDPGQDLRFDVVVTFPGAADGGLRRIDRSVNAALGDIPLAGLADRLVTVYRSGRAVVNGVSVPAKPFVSPVLAATNGGLGRPGAGAPLPAPVHASTPDRWVGVSLVNVDPTHVLQIREFELDGQLDAPVPCGNPPFNIALWDVTNLLAPQIVPGSAMAAVTSPRNDRTCFPVNLLLQPGHRYKLVARVTELRATTVPGEEFLNGLNVKGGLNFKDSNPCVGSNVITSTAQPTKAYLSARFGPLLTTDWVPLGAGLPGTLGVPQLAGSGELALGEVVSLSLTNARPLGSTFLIVGFTALLAPLKGGVLVPAPAVILGPLPINASGALTLATPMPAGLPPQFPLYFQHWIPDPAGAKGFAASNGLSGTPQY